MNRIIVIAGVTVVGLAAAAGVRCLWKRAVAKCTVTEESIEYGLLLGQLQVELLELKERTDLDRAAIQLAAAELLAQYKAKHTDKIYHDMLDVMYTCVMAE